jgi:hypothetical protein
VSELALDNDQRDAFTSHLDGVGVAELVRREPAPYSRHGGRALVLSGPRPATSAVRVSRR